MIISGPVWHWTQTLYNDDPKALEKGNPVELVEIFALYDRFEPDKNVTVPSWDDMTHMPFK